MNLDLPGLDRAFHYRDNRLYVENISLHEIARCFETPCYIYSRSALVSAWRAYQTALHKRVNLICYALKANDNLAIINCFARLGAGADVVSGGELARALAAGVPPERIVFSGVGKTKQELHAALTTDIRQINIESEDELDEIIALAAQIKKVAPVALRVNPDIAGGGHDKITTGRRGDKFGIAIDHAEAIYHRLATCSHIQACGLALHIGSQIETTEPFRNAFDYLIALWRRLDRMGLAVPALDLGGGCAVDYRLGAGLALSDYATMLHESVADFPGNVIVEPGRYLVAKAGLLLSRVIRIKQSYNRNIIIVDAGMNDLLRPSLYQAYHEILPVTLSPAQPQSLNDIVGPICESGDAFARDYLLTTPKKDDLIAIATTGAYGSVMASRYNSRLLPTEVMVAGDHANLIRRQERMEDVMERDIMPTLLLDELADGD